MNKEDKDFLKKLVFDRRFPLTEENTTPEEMTRATNIMHKYTKAEVRDVMREARDEMAKT